MKTMIRFGLLVTLAVAAFINPLSAQDATKELSDFTKKFEQAYNRKDDKSIKELYTKDATRIGVDGKVSTGSDAIGEIFAAYFKDDVKLALKQDKVVESDGSTSAVLTMLPVFQQKEKKLIEKVPTATP